MCLVVLLHYSFYTKYYSSGLAGTAATVLCVVCVPLFFLVNGALLLPRRIKPHHYRNVLKMILVVLVWKVIAALFFVFANAGHQVSFKDFLSFLLGGQLGGYPAGYFWFMNALIGIYLVFPLVKQAFDSRDRKPLIALVAVIFGFTVCKDTLKLLLQLLGMVTGHEFASLLGGGLASSTSLEIMAIRCFISSLVGFSLNLFFRGMENPVELIQSWALGYLNFSVRGDFY